MSLISMYACVDARHVTAAPHFFGKFLVQVLRFFSSRGFPGSRVWWCRLGSTVIRNVDFQ